MWPPSSDDDEAETPSQGIPDTPDNGKTEPNGRALTERARRRDSDRAALERLAAEINKSLAEYARTLRYEEHGR